jgi:predicted transcriptional regulator
LKKEFGGIWAASDAVINTQRAGLMARMFELGLIEKEKDGVKVNYKISDKGKSFLGNMS